MSLFVKIKFVLFLLSFSIINNLCCQQYEHLIIYGQSLSTGQQSWPPISTENVAGNFMIGRQVWTNRGNSQMNSVLPLTSNVSASTINFAKSRNSQVEAECPAVGMVNHLQLTTNSKYKFLVSSCGTGGKTIEELSKNYYNPIYYKDYLNTLGYGFNIDNQIHCPAIVWMQGEYNYEQKNRGLSKDSPNATDKEEYKFLFMKLKKDMQTDLMTKYNQVDAPVFVTYQTRGYKPSSLVKSVKELTISMAQLEAANENDDVVCAGPIYQMTDRGTHLDPNGYRWYGEMLAKAYYQTIIQGKKFIPLQPVEFIRLEDPKQLKIKFYVPYPPLVIDKLLVPGSSSCGFQIYMDGSDVPETITASLVDDEIILTSTRNLAGDLEIAYGTGVTYGNGNLRDSDPYQAKYNYVDLDKKDENGNYIYERDATETTLRPGFEPKDEDGIIYDKPYPLYNFCVTFYYKMQADQQSFKVANVPTGIKNETFGKYSVRLTSNSLDIEGNNDINSIEIIDSLGKIIKRFSGNKTIQFSKIPRGVYYVKINTNSLNRNYILKQIVK